MSASPRDGLRVALLGPSADRFMLDLGTLLARRGQRPTLIVGDPGRPGRGTVDGLPVVRVWRPADGQLTRRMYEPGLTHLPLSYLALRAGRYDIAHATRPGDALAAARWAAHGGRASLLSYPGVPSREDLAGRRLRLAVLERALAGSDATVVADERARAAFLRWLGVEVRVIAPGDVEGYESLYRDLLGAAP